MTNPDDSNGTDFFSLNVIPPDPQQPPEQAPDPSAQPIPPEEPQQQPPDPQQPPADNDDEKWGVIYTEDEPPTEPAPQTTEDKRGFVQKTWQDYWVKRLEGEFALSEDDEKWGVEHQPVEPPGMAEKWVGMGAGAAAAGTWGLVGGAADLISRQYQELADYLDPKIYINKAFDALTDTTAEKGSDKEKALALVRDKGDTGKMLELLAEVSYPISPAGFLDVFHTATRGRYIPETTPQKVFFGAATMAPGMGIMGAFRSGKVIKDMLALGATSTALEVIDPKSATMQNLIAGVAHGGTKAIIDKEFRHGIATGAVSLKQSISDILTKKRPLANVKFIENAQKLGFDINVGSILDSDTVRSMESNLVKNPVSAKPFFEEGERISGQITSKLEEMAGTKFSELPEVAKEAGEKAQTIAQEEIDAQAARREDVYAQVGEGAGNEPVEATTTRRYVEKVGENQTLTPEAKKFVDNTFSDMYDTTAQVQEVLSSVHPEEHTHLELGDRVKGEISEKKAASKQKYRVLYAAADEGMAKERIDAPRLNTVVNAFQDLTSKIGEWRIPGDEFKTAYTKAEGLVGKIKEVQAKSKAIIEQAQEKAKIEIAAAKASKDPARIREVRRRTALEVAKAKQKAQVPLSTLVDLEKSIHQIIDYTKEHGATGLFKEVRGIVGDLIDENTKNKTTRTARALAKEAFSDHMKAFVDPEAVHKMSWSQTPEDIATLLRKPSNFHQLEAIVGKETANAMRRSIVEDTFGEGNLATGKVKGTAFTKLKHLKSVFGDDYASLNNRLAALSEKTHTTTAGKLVAAAEKIEQRLRENIGPRERAMLQKARQSIVQDIRAVSPKAAETLSKGAETLGTTADKMQAKMVSSLISGNPETICSSITNLSQLRAFERAMGDTPRGRQMVNTVKRIKLQQEFSKNIFDKDGLVSFSKLNTVLTKMLKDPFSRELIGKDNIHLLESMQIYAAGMERSAKLFSNPSGTHHAAVNSSLLAYTMYAFTEAAKCRFGPIAKVFGLKGTLKVVSKFLNDPKVKQKLINNMHKNASQILKENATVKDAYIFMRPVIDWGFETMANDYDDE